MLNLEPSKVHYLSPGPSRLPVEVRERLHAELLDTFGIGVSIMEISHRSKLYSELSEETLALIARVLGVPSSHALLLTPFGAQQHFSLLIHHMSRLGETVSYVDSGIWAGLAVKDAKNSGRKVDIVYNGSPNYRTLGEPERYQTVSGSQYLHLTVNNTVYGTEYPKIPNHVEVPLVLDMTSSLAARQDIPWEKTGLIYASAQKNFGIAGMSVVIMKKDLLERSAHYVAESHLGDALSYAKIFEKQSALNTPPVFSIFAANRYFKWIESVGGVAEMERRAQEKAQLVYSAIDGVFYRGLAEEKFRSRHNIVFVLQNDELTEKFISQAAEKNILEVRGYRNVGGIRASFYNGVEVASAKEFANFMRMFRDRNG